MAYQDIVDQNGSVVTAGYRECASRYEVVRGLCLGLRRPFTVLDLGAAEGYFSIRLSVAFGARCTAVETRDVIEPARDRVAEVVRDEITPEKLAAMGTFDVVLGLSFLHHVADWRGMLDQMSRTARSLLIVETPNPNEKLKQAKNRAALLEIHEAVRRTCPSVSGNAPAVWESDLLREMSFSRRDGIKYVGKVGSGSGQNSVHTKRLAEQLERTLGYRMYPGSLNLKTPGKVDLGPHCMEFVDQRRGRGGRRGGDYQIWHASVDGFDGPVHAMRPGMRGHGDDAIEIWAPVKLREHLALKDGDEVTVRIGA